MVTPRPRSTPASSTQLHEFLPYVGTRLRYAENAVNTDATVSFVICIKRGYKTTSVRVNGSSRFMVGRLQCLILMTNVNESSV